MTTTNVFNENIDDLSLINELSAIGETPDSRANGLEALRKKLLQTEDLKSQLDDEFLLRFLRVAKFDVKKAYERVLHYYSVRRKYNEIFKDFYPTAVKTLLRSRNILACPSKPTDQGIVLILKPGMVDYTKSTYDDEILVNCLVMDFICQNPFMQVCGAHLIMDFDGYGFHHFINHSPIRRVRTSVDILQNSLPARYKSVHIINAPRIFYFLYALSYPFFSAKIKKRIYFHNNNEWKNLHSFLPPEILPVEYGGTVPSTELVDLTEEIIKKDEQFKELLQYGFFKQKT